MSFEVPPFPGERSRRLTRDGISVEVPGGWEARMRRANASEEGGRTFPVVHASTVALTGKVADYGGGAVEKLGAEDVFVSLVEFGDEAVGSSLFKEVDVIPTLHPRLFGPNQLQRRLSGQSGAQIFFTFRGRAFCLYVVLGSHSRRASLTNRANQLIGNLDIDPMT